MERNQQARSGKTYQNGYAYSAQDQKKILTLDPQLRIVTAPGGMIVFSGAQMHSSVPNSTGKTRFSIDFRTVNLADLEEMGGATNIDSECTGTTMSDYLQVSTLNHIRDDIVRKYLEGNITSLIKT